MQKKLEVTLERLYSKIENNTGQAFHSVCEMPVLLLYCIDYFIQMNHYINMTVDKFTVV